MTLYGFLASLVWAGVGAYGIRHFVQMGERWITAKYRVPEEDPTVPSSAKLQIPDDLEAVALAESEPWAQDDLRAVIKEKFLELHTGDSGETWQRVRRAVGVGELP